MAFRVYGCVQIIKRGDTHWQLGPSLGNISRFRLPKPNHFLEIIHDKKGVYIRIELVITGSDANPKGVFLMLT